MDDYLRVPSMIFTLGVNAVMRGLMVAHTGGYAPQTAATDLMRTLASERTLGIPNALFVWAAVSVLVVVILQRTPLGRYIYAIGGNEQVARLSGIRVDWIKIGVYVLCSTLAALTGLLYLTRAGVGDPVTGEGAELQAITAVILGGTSLFGGQGGLIGTLGGVLLMGLTNNVLVILNVSSWYQELIQGLVIVGAVALYKQKRR